MAGVGGKTINELKENLTAEEFGVWLAYRQKRGPLNHMFRTDYAIARLSVLISRVNGGKLDIKDFMPYIDEDEVNQENDDDSSSLSDFVNAFKGKTVRR